jgi:hypothetical protein
VFARAVEFSESVTVTHDSFPFEGFDVLPGRRIRYAKLLLETAMGFEAKGYSITAGVSSAK